MGNYNKKCLIIEDSTVQAKVIALMVEKCGWHYEIAHNLKNAATTLDNNDFALIFADLVLPDAPNGQSVRIAHKIAPNSIIVAMSASSEINLSQSLLFNAKSDGASFLLAKPFNIERLQSLMNEIESRQENHQKLPHILVIDDSRAIRNICENILKEVGFRVTLAEDVSHALEEIDLLDIDLLLCDLNMPGIAPSKAIPYIRETIPMVGIIAMSGNMEELHEMLSNGADEIIAKPFDMANLVLTINQVLSKHDEEVSRQIMQVA